MSVNKVILVGRLGRDPEFFRYVQGSVSDRILSRARHALTVLPTHENPYLQFILNGQLDHSVWGRSSIKDSR